FDSLTARSYDGRRSTPDRTRLISLYARPVRPGTRDPYAYLPRPRMSAARTLAPRAESVGEVCRPVRKEVSRRGRSDPPPSGKVNPHASAHRHDRSRCGGLDGRPLGAPGPAGSGHVDRRSNVGWEWQ